MIWKLNQTPPRIHDLLFLIKKINIEPPEKIDRFLIKLNGVAVVTRYPDELNELQSQFTNAATENILSIGSEVLQWIKKQF